MATPKERLRYQEGFLSFSDREEITHTLILATRIFNSGMENDGGYTLGPSGDILIIPLDEHRILTISFGDLGLGHYSYLVQTWTNDAGSGLMNVEEAIEAKYVKNEGKDGLFKTSGVSPEWLHGVQEKLNRVLEKITPAPNI